MEKKIIYPKDKFGRTVKEGDMIQGFGHLVCNGGFKIDRTSIVTANIQNGILYFGQLSAASFPSFVIKKFKPINHASKEQTT